MDPVADSIELEQEASLLVGQLAQACARPEGTNSFSPSTYDTAWVAMVAKVVDGDRYWRFPECFQYVLDHQKSDGSWESYASEVDGILNTMAGLLALKVHLDTPQNKGCILPADIENRISNAYAALKNMLQNWDVQSSVHVGFEILVPALLQSLEKEGFFFEIPGHRFLKALNEKKLAKFDPRMLYSKAPTTLLHSLEAFTGRIDFDRVGHHKIGGSMMCSPSATAAFLINSSIWDHEAEEYLAQVVTSSRHEVAGGIPSAYPTTIFMLTWATSTLLSNGFETTRLGSENLEGIAGFLELQLSLGKGLVGFAPKLLEDADDTAKAIFALSLLGRPFSPDQMIAEFENGNHFKTYSTERNPSFSANCNILISLLYGPEPEKYLREILKAATFLCDLWFSDTVKDKWNLSPLYSAMLLSQALVRLLDLWDHNRLDHSFDNLIKTKTTVVLCEILIRALQSLEISQSAETTSYAVIALTYLSSLPWSVAVGDQLSKAIESGKCTIREELRNHASPTYLWVEKVTYSSAILHRTYCLAALKVTPSAHHWGDAVSSLAKFSEKDLAKFTTFFSRLPLFSGEPEWKLRASLIEGYLFLPKLKRTRLEIFPRKDMAEDKYLEYIPFTWTTVNNRRGSPLSADLLWDMMVLSMLNYQADEYMEAVVGEDFKTGLEPVRDVIVSLCKEFSQPTKEPLEKSQWLVSGTAKNGTKKRLHEEANGTKTEHPRKKPNCNGCNGIEHTKLTAVGPINEVSTTLSKFITHQTTHPLVQRSSLTDRQNLLSSIQTFLFAHLTQIEDNARFSSLKSQASSPSAIHGTIIPYATAPSSYFNWVRTTSAAHTSCPYSFAYLTCLLGGATAAVASESGTDGFQGAKQKYYAQALCGHLATMCRQYNDYGSVARDRAEGNVNSVDFPEFHHQPSSSPSPSVPGSDTAAEGDGGAMEKEKAIKEAVLDIAGFERECLRLAQGRLEPLVGERVRGAVGVFVDVTDLYGQIYVARDIASRMK